MPEVDVLHGGFLPKASLAHPGGDLPVLAAKGLPIDEQSEAFFEGELAILFELPLLQKRLQHSGELETGQLIECGVLKHDGPPV
jgi:hypothetical protein